MFFVVYIYVFGLDLNYVWLGIVDLGNYVGMNLQV